MRKSILLTLVLLTSFTAFSQDFSNKGKDFYLCFPQHVPSGTLATLSIWITSDRASSGTITMANGAFTSTFNIAANGLAEIQIPHSLAHISNGESSDGVFNQILKKSIRVKVDPGKPAVVAYAQQWGNARSAATLLLPVNVLGKKYYAISFNQSGSNSAGYNARSQFQVIAVKDNTVITVTPMKNGAKGTSFTLTLPLAGDMIQYQSTDAASATQDLTGTLIESVASGSGGCLPIAVFSGSSNLTMGTQTPFCSGGSYDPLFQQLYPVSTWGKNFGFIPLINYPNGVPYRVMASEDNTTVSFNGAAVAVLNAGQIYPAAFTANPATLNTPTSITADKPICVAEYAQSSGCAGNGGGANQGDPDMVILNPIEQNISDITIFSTKQQVIRTQWINILMKTIATPSFRISRNGCALTPPTGTWQPFAALPGFSYLREPLTLPGSGTCTTPGAQSDSYRLVADSGFNAIAYGLGDNETYAYSAGTYIKDPNTPGVFTAYGIENNKVCVGKDFKLKIPLPYLADSIYWDVSTLPGGYPNTWSFYPPSIPDSTTGTSLRPIYWYSPVPNNFVVNTPGTYVIKATTYSPNTDGCGNEQDVEFEVEVTGPPLGDFTNSAPRCVAESVQFNDASVSTNPLYKWWWDFGDPASGAANNSLLAAPNHLFTGAGTFDVRYVNITTPGCLSDTIHHLITLAPLPTATLSGNTSVCINAAGPQVVFTGSGSTAPYTFYYHMTPGGGPFSVNSGVPTSTTATITAPTLTAGPIIYTLDSIRTIGSTQCVQSIVGQQVTINVLPNHSIALAATSGPTAQTRCINNAITDIKYDLGGGATGATVTGLPAGVTFSVTGTVLTITGIPNPVFAGGSATYPYTVNTTGNACVGATATGSITVNADHTLAYDATSGATAQTVCINTGITQIRYNIGGGATGVTITGLPAGVTFAVVGTSVQIQGSPTTTVGSPFTYTINTTGNACVAAAPLTGTLTVNPNHSIALAATSGPTAQTRCINNAITDIKYDLGGGATGATVTGLPAGVTFSVTGTVLTITGIPNPVFAGGSATYPYTVNTTGNACVGATATGSITVNADHTLAYDATSGATAQTVCINTGITQIRYNIGGGATGVTITGLPAGVTFAVVGTSVQIQGSPTTTVGSPFTYTINTTGNACVAAAPLTGTLTVNPNHSIALAATSGPTAQTRCINNAITDIKYDLGGGATGATVTGLPAGVTFSVTGTVLTITGIPNPVFAGGSATYPYTVNTTGNACVGATATGSITVNADHTLAYDATSGATAQTVCINTGITQIRYNIGGGATGVTITGLPAGVTFAVVGTSVQIQGSPTTTVGSPFTYTINTTGNACVAAAPLTGTLTVNPNHSIALAATSGPTAQTRCINNAITDIKYDLGGGATGATVTGLPAGVTFSVTGTVLTITGIPNPVFAGGSATYPYTVNTTGNACVGATATGSITVNADHTLAYDATSGATAQTVCINTGITQIRYNIGGGATGVTITGLPAGVTFAVVGTSVQIQGSPTTTVGSPFTYTINTTGNACVAAAPLTGTLTVNPNHSIALAATSGPTAQTRCINNAITDIKYDLGGGATGATVTGLPAGVTFSVTGTVLTITGIPNPVFAGGSATYPYTVNTTGNTCVGATATGSITVNADHTLAYDATSGATAQTVCINTGITQIRYNIGGGATGVTITGLPAGVTFAVVGTSVQIQGSPTTTVGSPFTYTINTTGNACVAAAPLTGTLTVNPNHSIALAATSGPTAQTRCINNAITDIKYDLGGGATGATVTGLPAGVTFSVTGTVLTITGIPNPVFAGGSATYPYTVNTTGNTCVGASATGSITVNADHTLAYDATSGATAQTVCINTGITQIRYNIGGGATGVTITGLPAGVTFAVVGTSVQIQGSPTTTVGSPFTYTINTTGNACVAAAPLTGTIAVNSAPTALISGTTDVCQNAPMPSVTFTGANATSPYTFTYQVNGGAPQTVTTAVGNNSVTVQQPTTVVNTFTYTLLSVQDGSITGCSQAQAGIATIKINPLPAATISGNTLVCINSTAPSVTFTGANGTLPYTFTYTVTGTPLPQTITTTGTNTSVSLPASTTAAGVFTYTLLSVQDGSSTACVQAQAGTAVVDVSNVFPNPDFTFGGPVCLPSAWVQFQNTSTISNGTAMTYVWNFGDGSPTVTLLNPPHQFNFVGPFNVTLQAKSNAGCITNKIIPVNNIHPQPVADFSINKPGVCIGGDVTFTDLSNGVDGVINQWHWDLGDGTTITSNPYTYIYKDTNTFNVTLYTVNSFGCNSDTITKPFTVYPYPKVNAGPDRFILEGGQITLAPVVYGNDLQFEWTPTIYLIDSHVQNVKINRPLTDMTYTLKVTARGGCPLTDDVFVKLLKFPVIPNTFTPNHDNFHDVWQIDYLNTYPDNRVQVFTRTGQLVFESKGYNTPWDGTIKGKPLPFDTYYYIIEPGNGRDPITGYVTILK